MKTRALYFSFFIFSFSFLCGQEVWKDASAPIDERVADLVPRLTLDEKISLLSFESPAIEHLGIPHYEWWNEALHGVGRSGLATVFPQSIGMAASWDPELLEQVFSAVSDEARAKNSAYRHNGQPLKRYQGLSFWTPNINIFRDPRWGRGQETYGEDPYLTSVMGQAVVRGLQGPDPEHVKTLACAKHYAVHSGPESTRHSVNIDDVSERDLWETYLPAFKDLVTKADVRQVMCAYQRFDGKPCCGNDQLLQEILRKEWGYKYLVVTDCWALSDFHQPQYHGVTKTAAEAGAMAVRAGTDLECGVTLKRLGEAVEQGLVSETDIDQALSRVLYQRFALGELDPDSLTDWTNIPLSVVDSPEHKALALQMALESIVLLANNNNILPLNRRQKVALMGPNAVDSVMLWGNYNGTPSHTITLLEALTDRLGSDLIYDRACDIADGLSELVAPEDHASDDPRPNEQLVTQELDIPASLARIADADIVIWAGGITPHIEGEEMPISIDGFKGGDRTKIELPDVQTRMLRALREAGKKVVIVNFSGSAMAIDPYLYDALLQAWYPGQAGGEAIAQVLMGEYNPSGRLPVTFYKSTEQVPAFEDYAMEGRTYRYLRQEPQYPFGYGLSYTDFQYGQATAKVTDGDEPIVEIEFPLTNTGPLAGDEVAQVYLRRDADTAGPNRSLRAFQRLHLNPGETATVRFTLSGDDLSTFNPETEVMEIIPGQYTLYYGPNSSTTLTLGFALKRP